MENKWFLNKISNNTKIAKVRLFLFPPAGCDVSIYSSWEKHFPENIEVCVLKLPGRGKRIDEDLETDINKIVTNIVNQIKNMKDIPFIFFGHSMGALIAYETVVKLNHYKMKLPEKLIVSGMKSPGVLSNTNQDMNKLKLYELDDSKLKNIIINLGGIPDLLKENDRFLDILIPILRNDLKLCNLYKKKYIDKIPVDIEILGGDKDQLASIEEMNDWNKYSSKKTSSKYFEGGHFYFYNNLEKFFGIINDEISKIKRLNEK